MKFQSGGAFDIDASSGEIRVAGRLDRELRASWQLMVTADNAGFAESTSSVPLSVSVDDVNDHSPTVRFPTTADRMVVQLSSHAAIGSLVTRVDAIDPDLGTDPTTATATITQRPLCHDNLGKPVPGR